MGLSGAPAVGNLSIFCLSVALGMAEQWSFDEKGEQ
jgi:hypothetical protein